MIKVRDNSGEKYRRSNHVASFGSKEFFFFGCGPFLKSLFNLLWYCCYFMFFDPEACGIWAPQSGIHLTPSALEGRVLTTGLSGNSLSAYFMSPRGHGKVFPVAQMVKNPCNAGDPGLILGSGRSSGEGNGNPLQYSCRENSMDKGACRLQSMGSQKVRHDWVTGVIESHQELQCFRKNNGEGNGTPLQYLCLENPMDAGAW